MPLQSATPAPAVLDDVLPQLGLSRDNRPVALVFLRSDCPWCATEVPRLSDVFARHQKLDLRVLGIAGGSDTAETVARWGEEKAVSFPVVADPTGDLRSAFAIERVPSVVIINGSGLVERTFEGVTEQLAGIVAQTLTSVANNSTPPAYNMVGNGCAP